MKKSKPYEQQVDALESNSDCQGENQDTKNRFSCPNCGSAQSFWRIECSPISARCTSCKTKLRIRLPKFRYFTWVLIAVLPVLYLISNQFSPEYNLAAIVLYLPLMFVIDLLVSLKWGRVERDV